MNRLGTSLYLLLTLCGLASVAAAAPGPVIVWDERKGDVWHFDWVEWPNADFYQVRYGKEGSEEAQERQAKGYPHWTITANEPGATYVFKVQACTSGAFGSSCSDWTDRKVTVPRPPPPPPPVPLRGRAPEYVNFSDVSSWESPTRFAAKVELTWTPGERLTGIEISPLPYVSGGRVRLPATATSYVARIRAGDEVRGNESRIFVCGYDGQGHYERNVGCVSTLALIPLPPPNAPVRIAVVPTSPAEVRISWRGDNVSASFEVERLQAPGLSAVTVQPREIQPPHAWRPGMALPSQSVGSVHPGAAPARAPGAGQVRLPEPPPASPHWIRLQPPTSAGGPLTPDSDLAFTDNLTNTSAHFGGAPVEPYTYRVCAVNTSGRTCSGPVEAVRGAVIRLPREGQ